MKGEVYCTRTVSEMKGELAVVLACRHSELRKGVATDGAAADSGGVARWIKCLCARGRGHAGSSRRASCPSMWWLRLTAYPSINAGT